MLSKYNVGYLRVSTANQVDKGEGLEIQRDRISAYCKKNNFKLEKFYEDRGVSGAIKDRPGLLRLLKDCEAGSVGRVIVYKQDRLSRELTVSLWLETQFKKHGVEVNSVVDPEYDLEKPLEKALKRVLDIFAELERDVVTARLKDGRINNAKNGERGSGPVPYGYVKVGDNLEIEPNEAKNIDRIFRWLAKGYRLSEVVRKLSKLGAATKRGKPFQIQSLKYIISNRMYIGQTSFGDFKSKGVHPAIVSKRLFCKVQKRASIAV